MYASLGGSSQLLCHLRLSSAWRLSLASRVLAWAFILRRHSPMFREAWLVLRERPLHLIRFARSSACLPRSISHTRLLLRSLISEQLHLALLESSTPSPIRSIQAEPGDKVVLVPPGVSRARVPLDSTLVLQILYGVVVALTVRPDTGAFRRFQER